MHGGTVPPVLGDMPETMLPEYAASMLRDMVVNSGYELPTWSAETQEWKFGNQTFKVVKK